MNESSDRKATEFEEGLWAMAGEMFKQHQIAVEGLTQKQTAEALKQAIACGDFQRLVRVDNYAQQVTYIPYRELESVKAERDQLRIQLEQFQRGYALTAAEDEVSGLKRQLAALQEDRRQLEDLEFRLGVNVRELITAVAENQRLMERIEFLEAELRNLQWRHRGD